MDAHRLRQTAMDAKVTSAHVLHFKNQIRNTLGIEYVGCYVNLLVPPGQPEFKDHMRHLQVYSKGNPCDIKLDENKYSKFVPYRDLSVSSQGPFVRYLDGPYRLFHSLEGKSKPHPDPRSLDLIPAIQRAKHLAMQAGKEFFGLEAGGWAFGTNNGAFKDAAMYVLPSCQMTTRCSGNVSHACGERCVSRDDVNACPYAEDGVFPGHVSWSPKTAEEEFLWRWRGGFFSMAVYRILPEKLLQVWSPNDESMHQVSPPIDLLRESELLASAAGVPIISGKSTMACGGGAPFPLTPAQQFTHNYFKPGLEYPSLLLWRGAGTGKTMEALFAANNFEGSIDSEDPQYHLLWICPSKLKRAPKDTYYKQLGHPWVRELLTDRFEIIDKRIRDKPVILTSRDDKIKHIQGYGSDAQGRIWYRYSVGNQNRRGRVSHPEYNIRLRFTESGMLTYADLINALVGGSMADMHRNYKLAHRHRGGASDHKSKDILFNTVLVLDEVHNLVLKESVSESNRDMKALSKPVDRVKIGDKTYYNRGDVWGHDLIDNPTGKLCGRDALAAAIFYSYEHSRENCVRALLLTATPMQESPMQLCMLLNLLHKSPEDRISMRLSDYLSPTSDFELNADMTGRLAKAMQGRVLYLDGNKDPTKFPRKVLKKVWVDSFHPKLQERWTSDWNKAKSQGSQAQRVFLKNAALILHAEPPFVSLESLKDGSVYQTPEIYQRELNSFRDYYSLKLNISRDKPLFEEYQKQTNNLNIDINEWFDQIELPLRLRDLGDLSNTRDQKQMNRGGQARQLQSALNRYGGGMLYPPQVYYQQPMNNPWGYAFPGAGVARPVVVRAPRRNHVMAPVFMKPDMPKQLKQQPKHETHHRPRLAKPKRNDRFPLASFVVEDAGGRRRFADYEEWRAEMMKSKQNTGSNWKEDKKDVSLQFWKHQYKPSYIQEIVPHYAPAIYRLIQQMRMLDQEDEAKFHRRFKHAIITTSREQYYGAALIASILSAYDDFDVATCYSNQQKHKRLMIPDSYKKHIGMLASSTKLKNAYRWEDQHEPLDEEDAKRAAEEEQDDDDDEPDQLLDAKGRRRNDQRQNNHQNQTLGCVQEVNWNTRVIEATLTSTNANTNRYGKNLAVMVLDGDYLEGIDLSEFRHLHLIGPFDSVGQLEQAAARAARFCKSSHLPFYEGIGSFLNMYVYCTQSPDDSTKTLDELYHEAQPDLQAINLIDIFINLAKEHAVDREETRAVNDFTSIHSGEVVKFDRSSGLYEVAIQCKAKLFDPEDTIDCTETILVPISDIRDPEYWRVGDIGWDTQTNREVTVTALSDSTTADEITVKMVDHSSSDYRLQLIHLVRLPGTKIKIQMPYGVNVAHQVLNIGNFKLYAPKIEKMLTPFGNQNNGVGLSQVAMAIEQLPLFSQTSAEMHKLPQLSPQQLFSSQGSDILVTMMGLLWMLRKTEQELQEDIHSDKIGELAAINWVLPETKSEVTYPTWDNLAMPWRCQEGKSTHGFPSDDMHRDMWLRMFNTEKGVAIMLLDLVDVQCRSAGGATLPYLQQHHLNVLLYFPESNLLERFDPIGATVWFNSRQLDQTILAKARHKNKEIQFISSMQRRGQGFQTVLLRKWQHESSSSHQQSAVNTDKLTDEEKAEIVLKDGVPKIVNTTIQSIKNAWEQLIKLYKEKAPRPAVQTTEENLLKLYQLLWQWKDKFPIDRSSLRRCIKSAGLRKLQRRSEKARIEYEFSSTNMMEFRRQSVAEENPNLTSFYDVVGITKLVSTVADLFRTTVNIMKGVQELENTAGNIMDRHHLVLSRLGVGASEPGALAVIVVYLHCRLLVYLHPKLSSLTDADRSPLEFQQRLLRQLEQLSDEEWKDYLTRYLQYIKQAPMLLRQWDGYHDHQSFFLNVKHFLQALSHRQTIKLKTYTKDKTSTKSTWFGAIANVVDSLFG